MQLINDLEKLLLSLKEGQNDESFLIKNVIENGFENEVKNLVKKQRDLEINKIISKIKLIEKLPCILDKILNRDIITKDELLLIKNIALTINSFSIKEIMLSDNTYLSSNMTFFDPELSKLKINYKGNLIYIFCNISPDRYITSTNFERIDINIDTQIKKVEYIKVTSGLILEIYKENNLKMQKLSIDLKQNGEIENMNIIFVEKTFFKKNESLLSGRKSKETSFLEHLESIKEGYDIYDIDDRLSTNEIEGLHSIMLEM